MTRASKSRDAKLHFVSPRRRRLLDERFRQSLLTYGLPIDRESNLHQRWLPSNHWWLLASAGVSRFPP